MSPLILLLLIMHAATVHAEDPASQEPSIRGVPPVHDKNVSITVTEIICTVMEANSIIRFCGLENINVEAAYLGAQSRTSSPPATRASADDTCVLPINIVWSEAMKLALEVLNERVSGLCFNQIRPFEVTITQRHHPFEVAITQRHDYRNMDQSMPSHYPEDLLQEEMQKQQHKKLKRKGKKASPPVLDD